MGMGGIDTDTIEHNGLGILGKNHFKAIKCDSNDVKVACFLKNPYAICEASGGFSLRSKINQNSKFFLKM